MPLLICSLQYPVLRTWFDNLLVDKIEPPLRLGTITNTPPQFADKVCQNGSLIPWHKIVCHQCFRKTYRCFSTKESLCFSVGFVYATPRGTQIQVT